MVAVFEKVASEFEEVASVFEEVASVFAEVASMFAEMASVFEENPEFAYKEEIFEDSESNLSSGYVNEKGCNRIKTCCIEYRRVQKGC